MTDCQGAGAAAGDTTVTHRIDGVHEPHLLFYGLKGMQSCLDGAFLEPDKRYDLWVAPELTPANARRLQFQTGAHLKHTHPFHTWTPISPS